MQLKNEFVVDADVDQAWDLLTDVGRIASSMPGAVLDAADDGEFVGRLSLRVGPVEACFEGSMRFTHSDAATRHVVIVASGEDRVGRHIADAKVHAWLEEMSPSQTRVLIDTDLDIRGRIAQFGRGATADAGTRLINGFAANIVPLLTPAPIPPAPAAPAPAIPAPTPVVADRYRQALLGALIGFVLSWLVFGRRTGGPSYIVLYPHPNSFEDQRITREWGRGSR